MVGRTFVAAIWLDDSSGGSWVDSRTKGEDELNGGFKNPGLNHWLTYASSSSSKTNVIIKSGSVEFSCIDWLLRVASEGKATLKGWVTKICSSDKEKLLSETDCSWKDWRWEKHKKGGLNCVFFFFVFSYWSHWSEADRVQFLKW